MFQRFGEILARIWPVVLLIWVAAVAAAAVFAPPLDSVVKTGEFAFLPENSPSRESERLFEQAFVNDKSASRVVIVARRMTGLTDEDKKFIDDDTDDGDEERRHELVERLIQIAQEQAGSQPEAKKAKKAGEEDEDESLESGDFGPKSNIHRIRTFRDKTFGHLLLSKDGKATLIYVELRHEFMDAANKPTVRAIENLLFEDKDFRQHIPKGLDLSLSGEAVVGRDMLDAAKNSAKATEHLTVILVVVLLLAIYRAPLLAIIPLMTVAVSVKLTMMLLQIGSQWNWIVLFQGIESYVTVLLYGAGVDYCLFLIARYKEEIDEGKGYREAVIGAVGKVGAAIAASAGTVICGIGMMIFAEFGKFHEAGIAISFGLVIVLLASLTFTPCLLLLFGRWVFLGQLRSRRKAAETGWLPAPSLANRIGEMSIIRNTWEHVGQALLKRPMAIWLGTIALMLPFALVGAWFYSHLSYGLLSDLSPKSPSVIGTKAVQAHFPAGATGTITLLLENPKVDFSAKGSDDAPGGLTLIGELTKTLKSQADALNLADVRSAWYPFGGDQDLESIKSPTRKRLVTRGAVNHYVSQTDEEEKHVTRLELTSTIDPFSRDSIAFLTSLQDRVREMLPPGLSGTKVHVMGSTASIRDLKSVTDRDQVRIDLLVVAGVFTILVLLLRSPGLCFYLILTVLFSYLVTLGVTYGFYWFLDGDEFAGLDWKVPMFLFTILIAVGEDYNIFLMTRIEEEQAVYGPVRGVTHALAKTGRIISSCGIIMAGTFASLMAGSLKGMSQLGFALAFGVLLDTFVVRPILVPAYLVVLHSGRLGAIGRLLGGPAAPIEVDSVTLSPGSDPEHMPG
jgi:putative drug exporter of the RND superfamily